MNDDHVCDHTGCEQEIAGLKEEVESLQGEIDTLSEAFSEIKDICRNIS